MDLRHLQRWLGDELYARTSSLVLLERFRAAREQDAFTTLFQRHAPTVQAICRSNCPDAGSADDALQETFVALFLTPRVFAVETDLERWLRVTARRIAQRRAAQARLRAERERHKVPPTGEEPPSSIDCQQVRDAIASLPEPYRAVVEMRFLHDLSPREIAERLGNVPEQTVWSRIYRGLNRLRPKLERLGFAPGVLTAVAASVLPGVSGELAASTFQAVQTTLTAGGQPVAAVGGRLATIVSLAVIALVGAAAVVLGTWGSSPTPTPAGTERVETLQEQNLRVFNAEVRPALLKSLEPYLKPFEGQVEWVRADGSEVSVLLAGARTIPPFRKPPRLLFRYCMLTRELQTDLDDPWTGQWRSINPNAPIIIMVGRTEVLRLATDVLPDIEKAFAALPVDPRAVGEFSRLRLATVRAGPHELGLPETPNIWDCAGNDATLFALNGKVIATRPAPGPAAEWRYLCQIPGMKLAVNDAALYTVGGGGGTLRRSRTGPDAEWQSIGKEPPRWGWNDLTATNELLFSAENTGRLWVRSAAAEPDEWSEAGTLPPKFDHQNCLCAVGGRLFAYTRNELFSRPASRRTEPWKSEGEMPEGTAVVVALENQLLTWTNAEWLTRPIGGGDWKSGGPVRRAYCPRWPPARDVVPPTN